jgi:hypothetical protein
MMTSDESEERERREQILKRVGEKMIKYLPDDMTQEEKEYEANRCVQELRDYNKYKK